ncbi:MAG: ATP-dependent helicase C-terminal domain-containing protein, partial [Bradymonadaceae bacterium]
RICVGRGGDRHYAMVEGEPLALAYESVAGGPEFLVASDIAGETRGRGTGGVRSRQLIREATALERDWVEELFPDRFVESVEVGFDRERERVMAVRRRRFGQVTLDESVASVDDAADDGEVARELVDAALDDLDRAFDLSVRQRQFLLRIESLRRWRPQLELPAVPVAAGPDPDEADDFRELLVRIAWGERSFDDLRRLDLIGEIRRNLTHEQVQGIEELAPPEFEAPSGYTHTLEYRPGKAPALEVRIQEMFGTTDHPAVAGGEVPVRLKLLAPNFRPAQITDDLSGFWEDTYHEVRKEYRADYPAHPWPEEPADAQPVAM